MEKRQDLKPKKCRLCRAETAAWRNEIICTAILSVRIYAGKQQTDKETGGVSSPCSITLREASETRMEREGGGAGLTPHSKSIKTRFPLC